MAVFDPYAERPWSTEEDKQLRNAVLQGSRIAKEKEHGRPVKWDVIAASLPRRSKKECRKRWHHTMMEAVRKCQWKPEEDERLLGAVQKSGEK
ncbi:myb-like DNA-binding protein bas1 [Maublancomyces gigas]|uniref:Myb-like DNA-binding protein bas1 n=1 Tax=Discina gigas TaxID=1032678 RepID=A0ABR3GB10_9PEZI